jgi:hypothetical protein
VKGNVHHDPAEIFLFYPPGGRFGFVFFIGFALWRLFPGILAQ